MVGSATMGAMDAIRALQQEGNARYREGRYEDARAAYHQAISLAKQQQEQHNDDQSAVTTTQLLSQLHSNCAQTHKQERSFASALEAAVKALEVDPANEKASIRRLIALENLEKFETAFQLVEAVLDARDSRERSPALYEYAIPARRRLRKNLQQDKAAAQKEVSEIGKMVSVNQQLRINFGCLTPSQVPLGAFFEIKVNLGNEFGLFRRDYVPEGEQIHLQCTLRGDKAQLFRLRFRDAATGLEFPPEAQSTAKLTINDRGKVAVRIAIEAASDQAQPPVTNVSLAVTAHPSSQDRWSLLPVLSLPFSIVAPHEQLLDGDTGTLGVHCCRSVVVAGFPREIVLAESPGSLGIGGKLWDSSLILTQYLSLHPDLMVDKTVVELGSGLGLVGICCAMLGARVTLTDIEEVVPLLRYNISLNYPGPVSDNAGPRAVSHLWGSATHGLRTRPDLIVLSDVVYDPEGYQPLVTSLRALAGSETLILMAHRSRNPMEHQFFQLLDTAFTAVQVDWASLFESHGSSTGVQHDSVLRDVKIFRITLRETSPVSMAAT
ncbi:TPA: hypothetical protein N0F65_007518 [Lagenidium giganteum]|uniref:Uncharacterized protein n=1 Tax=Lagenidium giganteum TaxID=4803 RepID=A0AAV2ZHR5_9STRA|nr:TPA: hypothetical protein N0F65_007518 [Lagenidium giganteum]